MFPITHIWFAEKLMGFRDSNTILGAVYPDIVITGCLEYTQTHYCGMDFYKQFKSVNPSFADAMLTHVIDPRGLDYYGDECYRSGYKGYCFQKGQSIVEQVIEACNIPRSYGLWKAHNFIEMGIELNILEENPSLAEDLHKAFFDKAAIMEAASFIESYYELKRNTIVESFSKFSQFVDLNKDDCYTLATKYNLQMQSKHDISIDVNKAAEIIDQCRSLIKPDIQEFFQHCLSNIKPMLEGGNNHE